MTTQTTTRIRHNPLQEGSSPSYLHKKNNKTRRRRLSRGRTTTTTRRRCHILTTSMMMMTCLVIAVFLQANLIEARIQWRKGTRKAWKFGKQKRPSNVVVGVLTAESTSSATTEETTSSSLWYSVYYFFAGKDDHNVHDYQHNHHHQLYKIETITTMKTEKMQKDLAESTTPMNLVKVFEIVLGNEDSQHKTRKQAIGRRAVDDDENDIHVSRLLVACEELEKTIRSIGFSHSANDIAGNVQKIRTVYDQFPHDSRNSMKAILQYELDAGVHHRATTTSGFKENSASMGFLWLARNINYQYDMFAHMLQDDTVEPYEAASLAYERDLKPHLPWALQKLGQAAMMALKPMKRSTILSRIGGFDKNVDGSSYSYSLGSSSTTAMEQQQQQQEQELATKRDMQSVLDTWKPLLENWRGVFSEMNLVQI